MADFSFGEIQKACGGTFNREVDLSAKIHNVVTDSRVKAEDSFFIALTGEKFDAHDFLGDAVKNGAVLLCVDKNRSDKIPEGATALLVESPLKAYQDLAAFHRRRFPELKVIALTGSYGKTSTKEILRTIFVHYAGAGHVLATEGNTNNQIGVPQNLLKLNQNHKYAVIEMGTNHFGEIEPIVQCAMPEGAMIVSIGNCHLEFFHDLHGVATEKSTIFKPESIKAAVFPYAAAERGVLEKAALHIPTVQTFGEDAHASVQAVYHGSTLNGSKFDLIHQATRETVHVEWNLTGRHQAVNAAGAAALAMAMGVPLPIIGEAIREVNLPGFRARKTLHGDALWINDAYNANPDSMCASLSWLVEFADPEKLLLVLGDMGELGAGSMKGHMEVISYAMEKLPGVRIALIGPRMNEAYSVLTLEHPMQNVCVFSSASEAVSGVAGMVRPGDLVFLKGSRSTGLEVIEPKDK